MSALFFTGEIEAGDAVAIDLDGYNFRTNPLLFSCTLLFRGFICKGFE